MCSTSGTELTVPIYGVFTQINFCPFFLNTEAKGNESSHVSLAASAYIPIRVIFT